MTDPASAARTARESLARGLAVLQSPGVPQHIMDVAEPVAQAMGALHQIEASQGGALPVQAPVALDAVRRALAMLQGAAGQHPAVDQATEAVAGSLGVVHSLTQHQPPAAPAPQPYAAPAPQPYAAPAPQPYAAPAAQPYAAPAAQPYAAPAAQPYAAPAPQPYAAPAQQPQAPAYAQTAPASPQGLGGTHVMDPAPYAQPQPYPQPAAPQPFAPPQPAGFPQAAPPAPAFAQPGAGYGAPPVAAPPWGAPQAPQPAQPPPGSWPQNPAPQPAPPAAGSAPAHAQPGVSVPMVAAPPDTPRVEANLGAHSPSNFYKGLSGNDVIDSGGIFIATYKIPKLGTNLVIKVALPGGYEFEALGVVEWLREAPDSTAGIEAPPGFGAKFTQISPEGRQLVYRYVRNREPLFHDDL